MLSVIKHILNILKTGTTVGLISWLPEALLPDHKHTSKPLEPGPFQPAQSPQTSFDQVLSTFELGSTFIFHVDLILSSPLWFKNIPTGHSPPRGLERAGVEEADAVEHRARDI